MTPLVWIGVLTGSVVAVLTLAWGGRPERIMGVGGVAISLSAYFMRRVLLPDHPSIVLGVDCLWLATSLALAFRYRRAWLQPYAGLSLLILMSDFALILDDRLGFYAVVTVGNLFGLAQTLVLAWGARAEGRRRGEPYPDRHRPAAIGATPLLSCSVAVWSAVALAVWLFGGTARVIAMSVFASTLAIAGAVMLVERRQTRLSGSPATSE